MPPTLITDIHSLGVAIRNARKSLRITQEELSLQTGISRPTIRSIERGKETSHIGLVMQICQDLGISLQITSPEANDHK